LVPDSKTFIEQKRCLSVLNTFLAIKAFPHALMFSGQSGVGKRAAARYFAKACNCSKTSDQGSYSDKERFLGIGAASQVVKPCNTCRSCTKIRSGNHPDIIEIYPDGTTIKISQIRSLGDVIAMKPYEADQRVVIIYDAHTMNAPAANALLKLLEEPPERTLLILVTERSSDLLPTVVSRCQHLRFQPISDRGITQWLMETREMETADAEAIAQMANGSYTRAVRLNEVERFGLRLWAIETVESLGQSGVPGALAFAEKLAQKTDLIPDVLVILQTWFRDLLAFRYHAGKIVNRDLLNEIEKAAQQWNVKLLVRCLHTVVAAQNAIQKQANQRRAMEAMALGLLIDMRKYPK
jgi:DNA polymerase III subunit delta'